MLFLSEETYDRRAAILEAEKQGKLTSSQADVKLLELDPHDHVALIGLGIARREAGDRAGAEEYFWRALEAHPCVRSSYMQLAMTLEPGPLVESLQMLPVAKLLLEDDEAMDRSGMKNPGYPDEAWAELMALPPARRSRLIARAIRTEELEKPQTPLLRRLWMVQQIQEDGDLSPDEVDAIVAEGEAMAPLLVGVLRDWAQNCLPDGQGDTAAENVLALLGEAGTPVDIPHLLEFMDVGLNDIASAAEWALGRIVERHPDEAVRFLTGIAGKLPSLERLAVLRHVMGLGGAEALVRSLGAMSGSWKTKDREGFFLLFCMLATGRGLQATQLARELLGEQRGLLSTGARLECQSILDRRFTDPPTSDFPSRPPFTIHEICAGKATWEEEGESGGEEDQLDLPMEPVRSQPERNDPCWCGSGKKYKKCHLDADDQARRGTPIPNEFSGLRRRIGEFLGKALSQQEFRQAMEEFGDLETQDESYLTEWIIHDWKIPRLGHTVMEAFLGRHSAQLTVREREMVEAWSRSHFGLYEVQDVELGRGITVMDLTSGKTCFVHDINGSKQLAKWDGLLARVGPGERGMELASNAVTVPRHNLGRLFDWMEEDRENTGLEWADYLKQNWPRVRRELFAQLERWRDSLRIANTDGDELVLTKSLYTLLDEAGVKQALGRQPGLEQETDSRFAWLNEKMTVLGNIAVKAGQLELTCNSMQRMERGKAMLHAAAGGMLQHLRDEFTTQNDLKNSLGEPAADGDEDEGAETVPPEVEQQIVTGYLERHYSAWPDTALPALGGKTPREAARTASGRLQVRDLLKTLENGEERKRQEGRPFYDVGRIRAVLKLD